MRIAVKQIPKKLNKKLEADQLIDYSCFNGSCFSYNDLVNIKAFPYNLENNL
tara:strand:- start:731 stop:886 length:156 start_codon:yes stop_codon:yes gene_type:complete